MCATLNSRLITAEGQLQVATEDLENSRAVVVWLRTKDEGEELGAEVAGQAVKNGAPWGGIGVRRNQWSLVTDNASSCGHTGDRTVSGTVTRAGGKRGFTSPTTCRYTCV